MTDGKNFHEENSRTGLANYASEANQSKQWPQIKAALVATIGALSAGTCISWSSPALPLLHDANRAQSAWIAAIITLGAFAGAIPAGMLANFMGRKRLLQLLALPMFSSWLLIGHYSSSVAILCIARFMAGIAIGAFSVAIPMYVAEIAESKIRGTLGTLFQLQITVGILVEYVIGMMEDFELMAILPSIIPVIFLIGITCMPESPVHLVNKNKMIDAKSSLQWLRGDDYDVDDEITRMQEQIREEEKNKASIKDLVSSRAASRALIIALGLMTIQQLSGINAVIFYTQSIFKDSESSLPSYAPDLIVGTVMVIATYLSTILIDRTGRRILLLISSSVMAACLGVLSLYFYLMDNYNMRLPFLVPLISIALYITVFSLGFGPIPWMMLGELFSPRLKGAASSISAAFNWLLAFTVTKTFQSLVSIFGSGTTFASLGVVCCLGTIFVALLVPETKGKDMEEILQILGGSQVDFTETNDSASEASEEIVVIDIKN